MLSLTDDEWGAFLPEETDTLPVYGLWTAPDGVKTWITAPFPRVKTLEEADPHAYFHQLLQQQQFEQGQQDFAHGQAQAQQAYYQAQLTQHIEQHRAVERQWRLEAELAGRAADTAARANLTPQPDPATVEPARDMTDDIFAWARDLLGRNR